MSKTIWNEGRVVGFSTYELYARNVTISGSTPVSEKEWLASTLSYGASMLLWVTPDSTSGEHYRDFPFPTDSKLGAANNIIASFFAGEGISDGTGWATKVSSYGALVENDSTASPDGQVTSASGIPVSGTGVMDSTNITRLQDFVKISDGVILQPGTWTTSEDAPPAKSLSPSMLSTPTLRLSFTNSVNVGFWLLLSGFINRDVLSGMIELTDSTNPTNPEDGDFLGPAIFPWATKVVFSVPPAYMEFVNGDTVEYTRKIPPTGVSKSVVNSPIIDMESCDPATYYSLNFTDSTLMMDVINISSPISGCSALTIYQVDDTHLPPSLYGCKLSDGTIGNQELAPIDVVAPGTLKLYEGPNASTFAEALVTNIPNNTAFFRNDDYIVYQINPDVSQNPGRHIPLSEDMTKDIAELYVYNTRYLWFFRNAHVEGALGPSQAELADTKEINNIIGMTGYVSDKFITDFCVGYDDAMDATEDGRICDGGYKQRSYLNQLATIYDFANNPSAKDYFKFFFYYPFTSIGSVGQQGMFLPVDVRTNRICLAIDGTREMNANHGFNFSASSTPIGSETAPSVNTDIMGAYWDIATSPTATTCSQRTDTEGVYAFENHPVLHNVVKDFETFWKPYTGVPKSPVGYNDQFVQWFSSFPVTDVASANILTAMGIHTDYHSIDFQSFMQYAATGRDMSQPMSSITPSSATIARRWYILSASDIQAIKQMQVVPYPPYDWDTTYYASAVMKAEMSTYDFFKMAELHIYELSTHDGITTEGDDITDSYKNSSYHQWVASGCSGMHETTALSLVDNNGALLPTSGASGSISTEILNWNVILEALSQNKVIDILGDGLRSMKSSGDNYIQLGNDMRLYISSTEPTGTIPEGSLGIGWGGIKVYTSGAWTTYS
jgi:hypothetical protein